MNYSRIYNQLIERAQNRILEGYKEKHHILPRCLGGTNNINNIAPLTAKEHFLCHLLLCEIYPNEPKLKQALWLMKINKKYGKTKLNSRLYEKLKIDYSNSVKNKPKHTPESKLKISNSRKGKKMSIESKQKISLVHLGNTYALGFKQTKETCLKKSLKLTGRKLSEKTVRKIIEGRKGFTHSKETKIKMSNTRKNKPKPEGFGINHSKKMLGIKWSDEVNLKRSKSMIGKNNKPVLQYDLNMNFIKEYPSFTIASQVINRSATCIADCCKGKQKTAGGFKWRVK